MVQVEWLGRVAYEPAWEMQKELVAGRAADETLPDRLLLLEHEPVYTLGRSGKEQHLLWDAAQRAQEGITVCHVDRGGDITYHGPGQMVGYPILNLKRLHHRLGFPRPDLHHYLRRVEELLIQTLEAFGVRGWRYPGYTGVWVDSPAGPRKIAAIGIKVSSRGISSHGFALNVDPNLDHFTGIVPCGIQEHGVTSLSELLDQPCTLAEVIPPLLAAFKRVFAEDDLVVLPSVSAYNGIFHQPTIEVSQPPFAGPQQESKKQHDHAH
jgi:lipoate-protein ligase B